MESVFAVYISSVDGHVLSALGEFTAELDAGF